MTQEPKMRIVPAAGPETPTATTNDDRFPDGLFRPAAVAHAHRRLEGSVLLAPPVSMSLLVWATVAMVAVALVFLASFQYSTYERVSGVLRNTGGELKVFPASAAVIERLFVAPGDLVSEGQPLATLRSEENAERGQSAKELQRNELERQIANLNENRTRTTQEHAFETAKLRVSLENAQERRSALDRQIELLEQQLSIDRSILAARTKMSAAGHIPGLDVETAKATTLRTEERLQQLRTDRSDTEGTIDRLRADLDSMPGQLDQKVAMIENDVSTLQRQLIPLEAQIEHTLRARQPGRVGNIVAVAGEAVQPQFPLMTLTSPDAELVAELYVPSRSRAFIRTGQPVHVRFESFPSEHYGDMNGTVTQVSDVMLFPDEWPNPMKITKPVYKVQVRLDRQYMSIDGEHVRLQQGIPVDADIVLERRSMLGHLLAPILKVKESLH